MRNILNEIAKLALRILEEYDEDEQCYVALCIDNGAIATGRTPEEAHEMIKLVLRSDLRLALDAGSLTSFYRLRADREAIDRWSAAAGIQDAVVEPLEI
jgi:hypothetical protein